MLAEIEQKAMEESHVEAKNQLELFGALLTDLAGHKREPDAATHEVVRDGHEFSGTWEQIVTGMRDANTQYAGRSVQEYMQTEARRNYSLTGVAIPTGDAESFVRGSADAGLLRIVR